MDFKSHYKSFDICIDEIYKHEEIPKKRNPMDLLRDPIAPPDINPYYAAFLKDKLTLKNKDHDQVKYE